MIIHKLWRACVLLHACLNCDKISVNKSYPFSSSEVASFVSFVVTKNPEITLLFQIPSVLYMYQILRYLFPTKEGTLHPLLDLLRLFLKR